eukprot:s4768_g6.t1
MQAGSDRHIRLADMKLPAATLWFHFRHGWPLGARTCSLLAAPCASSRRESRWSGIIAVAAQRALPWPASSLLEFPLHKVALAAGQPAAREVLQDRMCGEVTSRHMNVALCGFVVLRVPIGHPAFIQAWADERLMEEKRLLHETLAPRTPRRPSTTFCAPIAGYAAACGSTSAAFPAIAQLIWTSCPHRQARQTPRAHLRLEFRGARAKTVGSPAAPSSAAAGSSSSEVAKALHGNGEDATPTVHPSGLSSVAHGDRCAGCAGWREKSEEGRGFLAPAPTSFHAENDKAAAASTEQLRISVPCMVCRRVRCAGQRHARLRIGRWPRQAVTRELVEGSIADACCFIETNLHHARTQSSSSEEKERRERR